MQNDYLESIEEGLQNYEESIREYEACKESERQAKNTQIKDIKRELQNEVDLFGMEIEGLEDYEEKSEYSQNLKAFNERLKTLNDRFEMAILSNNHVLEEIQESNKLNEEEAFEKVQQHSRNLMTSAKERANAIRQMVDDANLLAQDINDEIREQNERLLEMEDLVKDAQSTLKRTQELVRFFARSFYNDLFVKIMIVLIGIAIIVVAILSVVKGRKKVAAEKALDDAKKKAAAEGKVTTRILEFATDLGIHVTKNGFRMFKKQLMGD